MRCASSGSLNERCPCPISAPISWPCSSARPRRRGERPFLWAKSDGIYRPWSWRRAPDEARLLARCLAPLGIAPGERVLILAENRPEWCVADLAILMAGGVTVPAYTTSTSEDLAYLLGHAEVAAVICSGPAPGQAAAAGGGAVARGAASILFMDAGRAARERRCRR